jgi:hypothetical protein
VMMYLLQPLCCDDDAFVIDFIDDDDVLELY